MDYRDELRMDPRPKDPSTLHLQTMHRSSVVWEAGGGDNLRSRRRNPNSVRFPALHPRMVPLLTKLKFDGVSRLTSIQIDWSLITALIERWRPETHTFHFPIGECMISLQDVNFLLGLQIDGPAITGFTTVDGGWGNYIEQVLGANPSASGLVGGRLRFSWLNSVFPSLPDDASDVQLRRYTQSYLLQLIGGVLFTDHSGGQVHCMYIPLIEHLATCGTLSWGSAVLAFLYMELCKSTQKDTEEAAGCILLLQLWAWTRLHTLAPVPRGPYLANPHIWGDLPGPHGLRWSAHLSFSASGSHSVPTYRLQLDVLADSHFIWQPYTDEIIAALPDYCRDSSGIWCYSGPLICFCFVEPHQPERCLRQFGMIQGIPPPATYLRDLHKINLKGKTDVNWATKHRDHIARWNDRESHVYGSGDVGFGVSDGYHKWYSSITFRYLTRIGGGHSYMLDMLDCIERVYKGETDGDTLAIIAHSRQVLQDKFAAGYYQDFPVEDRRVKEAELKGKQKRVGHKGGRGGVNAKQKEGVQLDGVHVDDEGYDHEGVHLDNEGADHLLVEVDLHIDQTSTHIDDNQVRQQEADIVALDHLESSFCPTFKLIPSDDSFWLSNEVSQSPLPLEQAHTDASPPLSHSTFNLSTQSPHQDQALHSQLSAQNQQQQLSVENQQDQILPADQHEQEVPLVQVVQHQQVLPVEAVHQQQQQQVLPAPAQAAQQLQQPVREHIVQLRTRKHVDRNCGTNSKKEIRPAKKAIQHYKRRRLVKKYQ